MCASVLEHTLYIIHFVFMFVAYFFFISCCGFVAANKDVYIFAMGRMMLVLNSSEQ